MLDDPALDRKLDHIQAGVTEIGDAVVQLSDATRQMGLTMRRLAEALMPQQPKDSGLREALGDILARIEDQNRQLHDIAQVQVDMMRTLPTLIADAVVKATLAART